ncbi:hypothetical protein [Methanoregula sp.]|uniref:hypothetical protein n=1 Tax=Methanoregula sp. TaxID=2052170 RepID=UPI002369723B|nr:hypothetical protein [Methanoregula sp.]MDD1687850.1 hypothetical protein [Methanoregula sp.]
MKPEDIPDSDLRPFVDQINTLSPLSSIISQDSIKMYESSSPSGPGSGQFHPF